MDTDNHQHHSLMHEHMLCSAAGAVSQDNNQCGCRSVSMLCRCMRHLLPISYKKLLLLPVTAYAADHAVNTVTATSSRPGGLHASTTFFKYTSCCCTHSICCQPCCNHSQYSQPAGLQQTAAVQRMQFVTTANSTNSMGQEAPKHKLYKLQPQIQATMIMGHNTFMFMPLPAACLLRPLLLSSLGACAR